MAELSDPPGRMCDRVWVACSVAAAALIPETRGSTQTDRCRSPSGHVVMLYPFSPAILG